MTAFHTIAIPRDNILQGRMPMSMLAGKTRVQQEVEKSAEQGKLL